MIQHDRQPGKRVMVKDKRVGLFIMPETRGKLNLVKAQISIETGQSMNQDEVIQYLIQAFEQAQDAGFTLEPVNA